MEHTLHCFHHGAAALRYLSATLDWRAHPAATHTGFQLWRPAATALARALLAHPALARGARVIEFGAGCAALPSSAALASGARHALATDGEAATLPLALASLTANPRGAAPGACAVAHLPWRSASHAARIAAAAASSSSAPPPSSSAPPPSSSAPPPSSGEGDGGEAFALGLASDVLWLRSGGGGAPLLEEQACALLACARRLLQGWGAPGACAAAGATAAPQACGALLLSYERRGGDLVGSLAQACAAAALHAVYLKLEEEEEEEEEEDEEEEGEEEEGETKVQQQAGGQVYLTLIGPCLGCLEATIARAGLVRSAAQPHASAQELEEELHVRSAQGRREGQAHAAQLRSNPLFRRSQPGGGGARGLARGQ
jgi:hypothetical protein